MLRGWETLVVSDRTGLIFLTEAVPLVSQRVENRTSGRAARRAFGLHSVLCQMSTASPSIPDSAPPVHDTVRQWAL